MGERSGKVRDRRKRRPKKLTVAVTGAASGLGQRLVRQFAESTGKDSGITSVIAIDDARGDHGRANGVEWRVLELTDPSIVSRLNDVDVVVHAAVDVQVVESGDDSEKRSYRNIRGTQTVLTAAAAARVQRVFVLTSAMVYGALPDNPIPLDEDAELRAEPDGGLVGDLVEVETICARAPRSHSGTAVTVIRPAALVGPSVDTVLTRHFEAPRLLVVRGSSPAWQFCHIDDLASAVEHAVVHDLDGPLAVGCDGHLTQDEVEEITGRSHIELPSSFVFGTAQRLHRLGVTPAPSSELHYVTHPWAVASDRLRKSGWRPEHDNESALRVLMDEIGGRHALASRRIGRRETATAATIGAAGATVAILGTAVAVRKARKRRRN